MPISSRPGCHTHYRRPRVRDAKAGLDQQQEKQSTLASVFGRLAALFRTTQYDIALAVAQLPF